MPMSPFQILRGSLALAAAPPLTLLVCVAALIDLRFFRRSIPKAQQFPRAWGRVICGIAGARVRVTGMDNIDPEQTYIFAGNHTSQFDIYAFQGYFPHDFRWVAKKELFNIPLFGYTMRKVNYIPIDRSRGRAAARSLTSAARRIAAGTSVLIFPEGTRSPDGRLRPFKTGAIMLAIKAGVPLVPLGFNGTHEVLPKGRLVANRGDITIRIGTPIPTSGYTAKDKQELALLLQQRVAELLDPQYRPLPQADETPTGG